MAEARPRAQRSEAARAASRRNGAKSRGPKTAAGKAISARNALKHGLRARKLLAAEPRPQWIEQVEATFTAALDPLGTGNGELEQLLVSLQLIEKAEHLIVAEGAQVFGQMREARRPPLLDGVEQLRKLVAYHQRFYGTRKRALSRLQAVPKSVRQQLLREASP